ncbi:MAG: hypothetical protein SGI71_11915 [Verrucomicrobiota bacterium]|nr:hypothetical protein [Verrucomicrobiota bacterium]
MQFERHLMAAEGYFELGMFIDAWKELDKITLNLKTNLLVISLRVAILMRLKRWQDALEILDRLSRIVPGRPENYIQAAVCLHELNQTVAAREKLLSGPKALESYATYHYNLACYETVMGNINNGKKHLRRALDLDQSFASYAVLDPELKPIIQCWKKPNVI